MCPTSPRGQNDRDKSLEVLDTIHVGNQGDTGGRDVNGKDLEGVNDYKEIKYQDYYPYSNKLVMKKDPREKIDKASICSKDCSNNCATQNPGEE